MDNECLTRLTEQSTLKTLLVKDASGETHEGQFGSICQNSKYLLPFNKQLSSCKIFKITCSDMFIRIVIVTLCN